MRSQLIIPSIMLGVCTLLGPLPSAVAAAPAASSTANTSASCASEGVFLSIPLSSADQTAAGYWELPLDEELQQLEAALVSGPDEVRRDEHALYFFTPGVYVLEFAKDAQHQAIRFLIGDDAQVRCGNDVVSQDSVERVKAFSISDKDVREFEKELKNLERSLTGLAATQGKSQAANKELGKTEAGKSNPTAAQSSPGQANSGQPKAAEQQSRAIPRAQSNAAANPAVKPAQAGQGQSGKPASPSTANPSPAATPSADTEDDHPFGTEPVEVNRDVAGGTQYQAEAQVAQLLATTQRSAKMSLWAGILAGIGVTAFCVGGYLLLQTMRRNRSKQ